MQKSLKPITTVDETQTVLNDIDDNFDPANFANKFGPKAPHRDYFERVFKALNEEGHLCDRSYLPQVEPAIFNVKPYLSSTTAEALRSLGALPQPRSFLGFNRPDWGRKKMERQIALVIQKIDQALEAQEARVIEHILFLDVEQKRAFFRKHPTSITVGLISELFADLDPKTIFDAPEARELAQILMDLSLTDEQTDTIAHFAAEYAEANRLDDTKVQWFLNTFLKNETKQEVPPSVVS